MTDDHTTNLLEYLAVQAMMRDLPGMAPRYQTCNDGTTHKYYVAYSGEMGDFEYIEFACGRCGFRFKDPIPPRLTTVE